MLTFHGVASQRYDHIPSHIQPSMCTSEFHAVLSWLSTHFPFLTPEEFTGSKKAGVLLTFDDGLANNVTQALPILEAFSAPAILFVSTQHVQNPHDWLPASRAWAKQGWPDEQYDTIAHELYDGMSEQQLKQVSKHPLITIGSHTVTHPFLTRCTAEQLTAELQDSRRYLQAMSGQPVNYFAYPTQDYNQQVAQAVKDTGYTHAFADQSGQTSLPCYEIPRIGLYHFDAPYLALKLSGLHRSAISFPIC